MTTSTATGTFDITAWDQEVYDEQARAQLGRVRMGKAFHGDIEGTSAGELLMIAVPDDEGEFQGRAYVGVERITGTVHGRTGDFVVTHTADMATGMAVAVVAGTGSGELRGLTGQLRINRADDGSHTYELEYELPLG